MRTLGAEDRGPLRSGRLLAERYELLERLGSGGMGVVYSAIDHQRAEDVAIKVLRQPLCADEQDYQRFSHEATVTSRLFHPNIVEVKDFEIEGEHAPYLVMELVRGTDLHRLLDARRTLVWPLVVDLLRQIGSALHAAHTLGIIHRDIKPSNILLTPTDAEPAERGDRFTAKVADFGISKIVGSSQPSYTAHGQIIGTPEYLSPEAVVGEPLDARTDQWSLGIVAYQMLTGRVPFGHRDELTTMLRVRTQALRPLRTLAVDVPRHVSDAIEVALSKRKEDRFATVQDFVRALSGLQPLRSSRRLSSRSRTDADAVPLPISQSNPLPVYVDPDSGPRSAPAPLRSLPPPTLRDAPSMPDQTELAEIVSERNEIAAPLRSAPAEPSVPPAGLATGPAAESPAAALRPAEGRPGWFRQHVRPLQRGLRAASLATVGLLAVGALQDVWHLPQPRLYAAEQGTPWRGSEEPLAGTSRSGRRYLVVPRQDSAPSELAGTDPAVNEGEDEGEDEGEGAGPDPAPGSDSPERRTAPVRADASRHAGRGPSVKNQELSGSARAAAALAQEEPPSEPAPAAAGGNVRAGPEATAPASPRPARPEGPSEPRGAEPRQTEPPGSAGAGARFVESDSAATNLGSAGPRRRFASLERKSGEDPHLLPAVRALYRGQTLQGRYLICVREDGSVESVTVKKAATDTDDEIVTTLKTWRYPPQPAGTLTCTAEILQFEL